MDGNSPDQTDRLIGCLTEYQLAPVSQLKHLQPTIVLLAEDTLLTEEGRPNREAISRIRRKGFDAVAERLNGTRWEGGMITTSNGSISFG